MAAMTERRSEFSAVAFADRYILAIGGQNEKGEALASVEIYDAQEGRWAPYASLATARSSHRCVCKLWLHLFFTSLSSAPSWREERSMFSVANLANLARGR